MLGLLAGDAGGVGEVVVDELFISLVDKGSEEENRSGDQGEAPQWDDLD